MPSFRSVFSEFRYHDSPQRDFRWAAEASGYRQSRAPHLVRAGPPSRSGRSRGRTMSFCGSRAALLALLFAGTIPAQTAPSISSLSPSSISAGSSAFFLLVGGSNFQNGAIVFWNGAALQTFLQSSGLLSASVTANLISTPGVA